MFHSIREFLDDGTALQFDKTGQPTKHHHLVGIVVLLWEAAMIDGSLTVGEFPQVVKALNHEFELSDPEVGELLEIVRYIHGDENKINKYVKAISESFDESQKQLLLSYIWKIVLSDGTVSVEENEFATNLAQKLGLTLEQSLRAMKLSEK